MSLFWPVGGSVSSCLGRGVIYDEWFFHRHVIHTQMLNAARGSPVRYFLERCATSSESATPWAAVTFALIHSGRPSADRLLYRLLSLTYLSLFWLVSERAGDGFSSNGRGAFLLAGP